MPHVADKHSGVLLAASAVTVTVGGAFIAVTALEPNKTSRSVWANAWFDLGLAFVIVGLLLMLGGIYLHFRPETPRSAERPPETDASTVVDTSETQDHHDSAISLAMLRYLIAEGQAMQARIASRSVLTIIPNGFREGMANWEARVRDELASRPEWVAQFNASPAPRPFMVSGPAGELHDELGQRIRVLKAIVHALES